MPPLGLSPYRKNVFIKKLISNYFSSLISKSQKETFIFENLTFETYATTNEIATNMLTAVAKLIGDDTLAKALISEEPEKVLAEEIDKLTNKSQLGMHFIKKLRILDTRFESILSINQNQDFYKQIFHLKTEEEYNKFYENQATDLIFHINNVINIICCELIPRLLKNKKISLSTQDFEEILSLITFENKNTKNNKKIKKQIQKTRKKLNKNNTVRLIS